MKGTPIVVTPEEYIAALEEPRRTDIATLDLLIREHAPNLERVISSGMLGYGPYHYRYASGHEGDTCRLVLASNKNYISLYTCAYDSEGYVAQRFRERLPHANIGKGCIRFKRADDLDTDVLIDLIHACAAWTPRPMPDPLKGR